MLLRMPVYSAATGNWHKREEGSTMTIIIDLPADVEAQLREKAAERGQEPAEYVADLVNRDLGTEAGEPNTLAVLFAGRVGHIHSGGGERLSEHTGEKFTDYLAQKRREGRL